MAISLVTGGAGFIGSHIAELLVSQGHSVVCVDDLSGGDATNVPAGALFIEGDICNLAFMQGVFRQQKPDYVFHCAAYAAEGLSPFIRSYNYHNNVVGSAVLVSQAVVQRVRRFVFMSSIAVYGEQVPPFVESMPKRPVDPYGLAKGVIEDDLELAFRQFGLRYTIFRPHNVYGERQNLHDPYRNVVGIFMRQCLLGKPMTIFGDGLQVRAFSYIRDIASTIVQCLDNQAAENAIYNIGADSRYTIGCLAEAVASALQVPGQVKHLPARPEVVVAYSNHRALEQTFGPQRETPLVEGLAKMASWARTVEIGELALLPCPVEIEPNIFSRRA